MPQWSAGLLPAPLNSDPGMKALEQTVNSSDTVTSDLVFDVTLYGADRSGLRDSTTAFRAAIRDTSVGGTLYAPPGTYKITGDLVLSSPVTVRMNGANLVSTGGRLSVSGSNVTIDGMGTSTFTFNDNGIASPYAIFASGSAVNNGSLLPITGTIAVGAVSFVATNAGDVSGLVAGQWLIVGERASGDWQRQEWKQVLSVAGTTVTVTTPFRNALATYTIGFWKVTPVEDVTVRNIKVVSAGVAQDCIGAYGQLCRNFVLDRCRFDVARGLAWTASLCDGPVVTNNDVDRQVGRASTVSASVDGYIAFNRFGAKGMATVAAGCLFVETGTCFCTFDSNALYSSAGGGSLFIQWADYNRFVNNTVIADGVHTAVGLLGGDGNIFEANHYINCASGLAIQQDTGVTTARTANGNTSESDVIRVATYGVSIGAGCTGTLVVLPNTDASVTTPVNDAGTASTFIFRDASTGALRLPVGTKLVSPTLAGAASAGLQMLLGDSSGIGSLGTRFSGADVCLASNAVQVTGADLWHQSFAPSASLLIRLTINGDFEFFAAAPGKADGNMATFWGTARATLGGSLFAGLKIGGTQVLQSRITGYTAMTGSPDKATAYATGTVTLAQLAGRVAQLQADLTTHGLIGP